MGRRYKCQDMGKVVTVHTVIEKSRDYETNQVQWIEKKLEKPKAGWIVGYRTVQNGEYQDASLYDPLFGKYEIPPHLQIKSTTKCVLVAFWPTQKPVYVPLSGYEIGGEPKPPYYYSEYPIDDRIREILRQDAKSMPRDAKGRFIKEVPAHVG